MSQQDEYAPKSVDQIKKTASFLDDLKKIWIVLSAAVVAIFLAGFYTYGIYHQFGAQLQLIDTHEKKLGTISTEIGSLKDQNSKISGSIEALMRTVRGNLELTKLSNTVSAPTAPAVATCPAGMYAVGIRATGHTSGSQCIGCLNSLQLVCAPVTPPN